MVRNKNVVITGCLQGIGKETLKVFSNHGATVVACAYKNDSEFLDYCKELEFENKTKIYPIFFDMSDNDEIKRAAKEINNLRLDIDGLVNVAGMNKDANFGMISYQDLFDTFQINVFSQILFSQYIVRMMLRGEKKNKSVVFTSSMAAVFGSTGQTAYSASKAAIIGAVHTMAMELGVKGIRVNAIAPGIIKSPMTDKLDQEYINQEVCKMDIPHIGTCEDAANLYMYLISDLSSHVSGQVIQLNGGM